MKKNSDFMRLITLSVFEINEVSGGERPCGCMNINKKDSVLSNKRDSEIECKEWCCDSEHEDFENQFGSFYIWNLTFNEKQEELRKC